MTPILGAFISDSYWGRFWTILVFSIAYMIGMIGLALDAGLPGLRPNGNSKASSGQLAFFWTAMYLVALGTGGIKPCVSSFGADQASALISLLRLSLVGSTAEPAVRCRAQCKLCWALPCMCL